MKILCLPLIAIIVVSAVGIPFTYLSYTVWGSNQKGEFFFGVSFGQNMTAEAKLLIDKVKGYTNFFLINSWPISTNETALNEVCDYAANANLHFIVFFDFISTQYYAWHQTWLDTAKQRWGDKFLGVYLYDEPGGKQVDLGQWDGGPVIAKAFENATSPSEAANAFVTSLSSTQSMHALKSRGIPVFTSDYALYWYDYMAGYDAIFAELGWNNNRAQQIALCRGAANAQGKDWGAILVWTYYEPPYLASGAAILQDMRMAYDAGAKYVIIFNYPICPETNQYGILTEEHFAAMKQFWDYVHSFPRGSEKVAGQAAFVLPKDYGWGARRQDDNLWGPLDVEWRSKWPAETLSPLIWENMNKLLDRHGLRLDIVYDGDRVNLIRRYSNVYLWNDTVD